MKCHQRYSMQESFQLIKSVFSDCELLKHAYLKLACLIGMCVREYVPSLYVGEPLWKCACPYRSHYTVCVNSSSVGNMLHSTNQWCVYSVSFLSTGFFSLHSSYQHGCLLHNFSDLDDLGVQVAAHFTDFTHKHTLFNLRFTHSLLGRSTTMCCSFQSMSAKGSKSGIKVRHGTPFGMLLALHLIKVQTENPSSCAAMMGSLHFNHGR